jgi:hypothetical protein
VALSHLATEAGASLAAPADDLTALRFVRKRVHHQWAKALELVDVTIPPPTIRGGGGGRRGGRVTMIRPASVGAWLWVLEAHLPLPKDPRHHDPDGKAAYVSRLEGQQAHLVLERFSAGLTELR